MSDKQKQVERHLKEMTKHTRKQQLRDARRKAGPKNQGKKPRQKKIAPTEWDDWDDLDEMDFETFELIMPKGERERRRKIEKQALRRGSFKDSRAVVDSPGAEPTTETPIGLRGLVVEAGSGMCRVDFDGETVLCDIRGTIKAADTGYVNVIAVGDQVLISKNGANRGVVESVLPRHSVLTRPYTPDVGRVSDLQQIVVSNVDQLLIVASWREPYIWPALIDRYLITARRNNIEAVICINKTDLVEDQAEFDVIVQTYQELSHRLILTSAVTGEGIDDLQELLSSGTTVLAGLSGVGKSSLLIAVQPSLNLKTGHVSEHGLFTGQGRHTTTQSSLWKLDIGGVVIDTPGVRSFGIASITPTDLAGWYPDLVPYVEDCRYTNCSHTIEPGCGIKTAVENGSVSPIRYKNYTQIFEELSR
jgi:ribosome biogenesis GTPase